MSTPAWWQSDMYKGDTSPGVDVVQTRLRAIRTGIYDDQTIVRVRGYQRLFGLPVTGIVDSATAEMIGEAHWFPLGGTNAREGDQIQ